MSLLLATNEVTHFIFVFGSMFFFCEFLAPKSVLFFFPVDVTLNTCMLKCKEANSNSESNYHLLPLPELSSFGSMSSSSYLDFYKLLPFSSSFLGDNQSFIPFSRKSEKFKTQFCIFLSFTEKYFIRIELFILDMETWKIITIQEKIKQAVPKQSILPAFPWG